MECKMLESYCHSQSHFHYISTDHCNKRVKAGGNNCLVQWNSKMSKKPLHRCGRWNYLPIDNYWLLCSCCGTLCIPTTQWCTKSHTRYACLKKEWIKMIQNSLYFFKIIMLLWYCQCVFTPWLAILHLHHYCNILLPPWLWIGDKIVTDLVQNNYMITKSNVMLIVVQEKEVIG